MIRVAPWGIALLRCMPVLFALTSLPAAALDVKLRFHLPNSMGHVDAGFTGFDFNRDGMIRSVDNEVLSAWSSIAGEWSATSFASGVGDSSGKIDIQYKYPAENLARSSDYGNGEYFGLSRFGIESKRESGNQVRNNSMLFRLDARQPSFVVSGFSWSDVYNAPSSFAYSFVGPENAVVLSLNSSGDVFAIAVPEPSVLLLMATGLMGLLLRGRVASIQSNVDSTWERQAGVMRP